MIIPEYAKIVAKELNKNGYEAYFVGGCVRDFILGKKPYDFDITTNASPDEIKKVFKNFKTILTGEKHGTVTVVSEGENIEVTTYRVDGEYTDSRHPDKVFFTKNVIDDLARRDFTMNAIGYNGDFVDPFGGIGDIEKKTIRTVGESDLRFKEDALRIMRALRFSANLGFEIEEETKKSIFKNKELLKKVSAERIYAEFSKLIGGKYAGKILKEYVDVIGVFIPEILPCVGFEQKNKYHIYDVYTHIVKAVDAAIESNKVRLAVFLHDIAKPECFTFDGECGHFKGHDELSAQVSEKVLTRLKVDNVTKNTVVSLVREHQREIIPEKKYVKRFLSKFSYEFFDLLMEVKKADTKAHSTLAWKNFSVIEECEKLRREIEAENSCISLKSLAVTGNDVIKSGIEPGKEVGRVLNALLQKVIDGECENEKESLLKVLKDL